jgi:hypothetical protein
MSRLNVLHFVPSLGESGGGPPRFVSGLCGPFADRAAIKLKLLFGEDNPRERAQVLSGVHTHPIKPAYGNGFKRFNSQGFGRQLGRMQAECCFDINYSHGLWLSRRSQIAFETGQAYSFERMVETFIEAVEHFRQVKLGF